MSDVYDKLLDRFDEFKPSEVPHGMGDFIDMVAQIYNGGPEQWIWNGYGHAAPSIVRFLNHINSSKADDLMDLIKKLKPRPSELDTRDTDDEDFQEKYPTYQKLEDWIYNDANMEALINDILDQLKPKVVEATVYKTTPEEVESTINGLSNHFMYNIFTGYKSSEEKIIKKGLVDLLSVNPDKYMTTYFVEDYKPSAIRSSISKLIGDYKSRVGGEVLSSVRCCLPHKNTDLAPAVVRDKHGYWYCKEHGEEISKEGRPCFPEKDILRKVKETINPLLKKLNHLRGTEKPEAYFSKEDMGHLYVQVEWGIWNLMERTSTGGRTLKSYGAVSDLISHLNKRIENEETKATAKVGVIAVAVDANQVAADLIEEMRKVDYAKKYHVLKKFLDNHNLSPKDFKAVGKAYMGIYNEMSFQDLRDFPSWDFMITTMPIGQQSKK